MTKFPLISETAVALSTPSTTMVTPIIGSSEDTSLTCPLIVCKVIVVSAAPEIQIINNRASITVSLLIRFISYFTLKSAAKVRLTIITHKFL